MNQFKRGDIVKHVNSGNKYEVIFQDGDKIKLKDFDGEFCAKYYTLVQPFQPINKPTMRTESVCIRVDNKEIAKIIWDFLLSKGFTEAQGFYFNQYSKYIWVNIFWIQKKGVVTIADNKDPKFEFCFNASTEFGAILDFFTKEPPPPDEISIGKVIIDKSGNIKIGNVTLPSEYPLYEIISERQKLLDKWAVYNNKNK